MENKTTIGHLFGGDSISFYVPNYQRAYSWRVGKNGDIAQVDQYLADVKEQSLTSKYYLGHYLFEEGEGNRYGVIDGQQRLTTTVIFMSRLVAELHKRGIDKFEVDGVTCYTKQISYRYLQPEFGRQKFETVSDDGSFFNKLIIKCTRDYTTETHRRSERRIKEASEYFDKEMATASDDDLERWFYVIDTAVITTFKLHGEDAKLTATQIFAFQNDRGLSLTTLEKLKAYLMHCIYRNDPANATANINSVESKFTKIYSCLENISTKEDTVLSYHCSAFISVDDAPLDGIKKRIGKADDKVGWIMTFTQQLCRSYALMEHIENESNSFNCPIADVCILDRANSMPLVLKLCHFNCGDNNVRGNNMVDTALRLVEKILFKLRYSVGGYRTNNLISIARSYKKDDYDGLIERLKDVSENGFKWYWQFNNDCLRYFTETKYHYDRAMRYVLYKYENYLRQQKREPMLTPEECTNIFRPVSTSNTLDHITPQDPDFTTYTEEFRNDCLNNIGNLSLLTWGNNSSKKNHDPASGECREIYNSSYYSQREIYETLVSKGHWGETEINERRERIVEFVKKNWLS